MSHGCFYQVPGKRRTVNEYLPQVGLDVHATLLSTTSRAFFIQTFVNPSSSEPIPEALYTFPLYDGSSVVDFTCRVGADVIRGKVKPKKKADEIYQRAKAKGQTAAIFDQSCNAGDIFKTRVGNVPAGGTVVVEITVVEELKQDAQTNGPRYIVPTAVAPRYGERHDVSTGPKGTVVKTAITIDVIMEKGCTIRNVRSPSHPIELYLGRASYMPESTLEPCYASVKLRNNAVIKEDFVLTVNADNQDKPIAFLETYPTLPNQQALMVSLVPKFSLPPDPSEIIFVLDRSGSMQDKIVTLKSALEVFLKSLPLGVPFNIVSFGSHCSKLWPRSRVSDKASLSDALEFTKTIDADMGGTEILAALKAAVENHYKDKLPEVLLLTDGQVWNQSEIFTFVTGAVQKSSARFFTLGIGNFASHSLVNGIARAGRGFSQSVLDFEELDKKVIRMLKGALLPRLNDCRLDLGLSALDDGYVEIESVRGEQPSLEATTKPISIFEEVQDDSVILEDLGQPLPKLSVPTIIHAPTVLPCLFPSIRSTVFVLFSNESSSLPGKVTLRANSRHGPLELEIPVQDVGSGETLHQLAAKKAMTELEESRGWIQDAKINGGVSIKENYESRMDELVQNECERLGVRFQIAGKHCSFVAIRETKPDSKPKAENAEIHEGDVSAMSDKDIESECDSDTAEQGVLMLLRDSRDSGDASASCAPASTFVPCVSATPYEACSEDEESDEDMGFGLFDDYIPPPIPQITDSYKKRAFPIARPTVAGRSHRMSMLESDGEGSEASGGESKLQQLIQLQTFEGYWDWCDEVHRIIDIDQKAFRAQLLHRYNALTGDETDILSNSDWKRILATSLVGLYLENRASESKDVWELLKEKADKWMKDATESMSQEYGTVARELFAELKSLF